MTIMFNDDDFITGLALGTIIASGDSMPEWRWSDFLVYGAAAIAAAVVGVYVAVTKLIEKKNAKDADNRENYVSCACFDGDFISETTVA